VMSYGISVPTLENVFLKVTNEKSENITRSQSQVENANKFSTADNNQSLPICVTFFSQLTALFIKRLHVSRRSWKGLLVEILIPAILILVGFGFSKI
jgi:uncharacterized membrane protein